MMFWICAAGLVALALLFVLVPLLRRRTEARLVDSAGSNLSVLRDQVAELDAELAAGSIGAEQHGLARGELERRALEEAGAADTPAAPGARGTAWVLGVAIPAFAIGVYLAIGNPRGIVGTGSPVADEQAQVTPGQVEEMVARLAQNLEKNPGNPEGWTLLGRTYGALGRFGDSARAYARASALLPRDAQLLVDHADALAMAQGRKVGGEPLRLIQEALKLDPHNLKALALAGSEAFERRDFKAATDFWQRAARAAPPGSELAQAIEANIAEARTLGNVAPPVAAGPAAAQGSPGSAAGGTVGGRVTLSPALAAKVAPTDTLFVFARAAAGPRMPLAILRRSAGDLPTSFRLDDSMAMAPEMKLSNFGSVVIGARVSKSGNAAPQSGDLQGQSAPIKVGGGDIEIVIDQVVP